MPYSLDERFSINYESGRAASYLVIGSDKNEKVLNYQVEMIANNSIVNILNFDIRQKNDYSCFYYNITSKLALSQFLKRRRLNKNEFINLLIFIVNALLNSRCYLLYDNCFILEEDYVFINPHTLEVSLLYLPIELGIDLKKEMRNFITKLIINTANIDESNNDNFLQKIIGYMKSDAFNISDLNKFLNGIKLNGINAITDEGKANVFKEGEVGPEILQNNDYIKPQTKHTKNSISMRAIETPITLKPVSKQIETSRLDFKPKSILFACLLQLLILSLIILNNNTIKSLNNDITTTYIALFIIIVAIDILVFKNLFVKKVTKSLNNELGKKSSSEKQLSNNILERKWSLTEQLNGTYNKIFQEEKQEEKQKIETPVKVAAFPEIKGFTEVRANEYNCETTLLGNSFEKYPCFRGGKEGVFEEIYITKPNFVIGRLKGQVDYLSKNQSIGKVHAEITLKEGGYFIKDINSKNGTFINNVKIDCNKDYAIKNNDKVSLANIEYTFIVP